MQIDDKIILLYFKILNISDFKEYILYSKENEINSVYISSVFHEGENIKFIKPELSELDNIKKVIQNLISSTPNNLVFSQLNYQVVDSNVFSGKNIVFVESQKVQLNDTQYNNFVNNKYLKSSYNEIIDVDINSIANTSEVSTSTTNAQKSNKKFKKIPVIILVLIITLLSILIIVKAPSLFKKSGKKANSTNNKTENKNNTEQKGKPISIATKTQKCSNGGQVTASIGSVKNKDRTSTVIVDVKNNSNISCYVEKVSVDFYNSKGKLITYLPAYFEKEIKKKQKASSESIININLQEAKTVVIKIDTN